MQVALRPQPDFQYDGLIMQSPTLRHRSLLEASRWSAVQETAQVWKEFKSTGTVTLYITLYQRLKSELSAHPPHGRILSLVQVAPAAI
jgi:hypothetical protein